MGKPLYIAFVSLFKSIWVSYWRKRFLHILYSLWSPCKSQWRYCSIWKGARGAGILWENATISQRWLKRSLGESFVLWVMSLGMGDPKWRLQYSLNYIVCSSDIIKLLVAGELCVDKVPFQRQHCWNFSYVGFHTAWTKHPRQPSFVIVAHSCALNCVLKYLWSMWW